ncbi:galactose oxidase-like domain-containing protein [Geodermatophilus sp. SYSU D00691]
MANLGNAWHIPGAAEPRGFAGMRDPVGAIVPGAVLTIVSGNQFQGGGNAGNQLQTGSAVSFRRADDPWTTLPMAFLRTTGNNKYYTATVPSDAFRPGDLVRYYLRIAYDDHDTTFVHRQGNVSARTADETVARDAPFAFTVADPAEKGRWGPVFGLPNVAVHANVLPDGRVLMWGRRDSPDDDLDVHECTPFTWNPADGTATSTPQPRTADGTKVNLFCSGHTFLSDGRLLVVGGHLADGDGLSQAALFDWRTGSWTPTTPMTTPSGERVRRWYPTATTLPSGAVLVLSGSYVDPARPPGRQVVVVDLLQVWENGTWRTIDKADGTPLDFIGLPLYPRMHVTSDGRVFMSGTNDRTLLLTTTRPGAWTEVGLRAAGNRDYCPAVLYDEDAVMYLGGGNDSGDHRPTAEAEVIDLAAAPAQWRRTAPMTSRRRQHNAVVLPDGTVLVTGGTRGGGGPNDGFNDLRPGRPVRTAELWDPAAERWTELTAESVDRCYHATAVLLPDATVLSAGGGEYRPNNVDANDPQDSHLDAQIFSPPYLFTGGQRPVITSTPESADYGETFVVGATTSNGISRVSLVRLPSVTHSFDQNQRICFVEFREEPGGVAVTAPAAPSGCPPGHYMLFLLDGAGVPSRARTVRIGGPLAPDGDAAAAGSAEAIGVRPVTTEPAAPPTYLHISAREAEVRASARGTRVVVGITGTCPYGIGACWGGAHEALGRLAGVQFVVPVPDVDDSTAEVVLSDDGLPDLDTWHRQFAGIVNGTYELRGIEVVLRGDLVQRDGELLLVEGTARPAVRLVRLTQTEKIQWDHLSRSTKPLEEDEESAFERLVTAARGPTGMLDVTVTGPLRKTGTGHDVHVRVFTASHQ